MKTIKKITTVALVTLLLVATSCKKDKKIQIRHQALIRQQMMRS